LTRRVSAHCAATKGWERTSPVRGLGWGTRRHPRQSTSDFFDPALPYPLGQVAATLRLAHAGAGAGLALTRGPNLG